MPPRLSDEDIGAGLVGLSWQRQGDRLVKVARRESFRQAVEYVNRVAEVAEEADHHPDITLSWQTVTLELWTHVAGGITALDLALAARIDGLG